MVSLYSYNNQPYPVLTITWFKLLRQEECVHKMDALSQEKSDNVELCMDCCTAE